MHSKTRAAFIAGFNSGRTLDDNPDEAWKEFEVDLAKRPTWRELAERLLILLSILFLIFYVAAPIITAIANRG